MRFIDYGIDDYKSNGTGNHYLYLKEVNDSEAALLRHLGFDYLDCNKGVSMDDPEMETWVKYGQEWIPVSSGVYPDDMEDVQVTYIGWNDKWHYCNSFAYRHNKCWYWAHDDEEVKVEIIAWRSMCDPYVGEERNEQIK